MYVYKLGVFILKCNNFLPASLNDYFKSVKTSINII